MAKLLLGEDIPIYSYDVVEYQLKLAETRDGKPISAAEGRTLEEGLRYHGVSEVDLAIDTSGRQAACEAGLHSLAQRGALILVGHGEELRRRLNVSADMIAPERAVLVSEYFTFAQMAANQELLQSNQTYLSQIITHRFGTEAIQEAFELFLEDKPAKSSLDSLSGSRPARSLERQYGRQDGHGTGRRAADGQNSNLVLDHCPTHEAVQAAHLSRFPRW
jgi:threonine 3-dehydrogenase